MIRKEYIAAKKAYNAASELFEQQSAIYLKAENDFRAIDKQWDDQRRTKQKAAWIALSPIQQMMQTDQLFALLNELASEGE